MDYYGITMKGPFFVESVATKPANSTSNKRRLIYAEDESILYFGASSSWLKFYTTSEIDSQFSNYYTTSEIDSMFSNYYTSAQVDTLFTGYYTSSQVDSGFISKTIASNVSANVEWQDNAEIRLGNSADFRMYHSGGSNIFEGNNLHIMYGAETMAAFYGNGGVELYHNNTLVAETDYIAPLSVFKLNQAFYLHSTGARAFVDTNDSSDFFWFLAGNPSNAVETVDADPYYSNLLGFRFQSGSTSRAMEVWSGVDFRVTGMLAPSITGVYDIGSNTHYWNDLYYSGLVNPSDRRLKKDISTSQLGLKFIDSLRPVQYVYKDQVVENEITGKEIQVNHHRTHYGFIAQEVKNVLDTLKIDTEYFAGYRYDKENDSYALNYLEFIGPLVKAVQELKAEIDILKGE